MKTIIFFSVFSTLLATDPVKVELSGFTMGTTYRVVYFDQQGRDFKFQIDSLLSLVNKAISTYDSSSDVSRFNRSVSGIRITQPLFLSVFGQARAVSAASAGAFDITIMPLLDIWGFGPSRKFQIPSRTRLDSILTFTGTGNVDLQEGWLQKNDARVRLDFGGIGQGYGADVVKEFLRSKGIRNALIEIGGEGIAMGRHVTGDRNWQIGILDPGSSQEEQRFRLYVAVQDRAFTTSGNYFNFHEKDGIRYGHTIDPVSGYPVSHNLVSVSVFADKAATADAWATAFLVMGYEKAVDALSRHPELDAILFLKMPDGTFSCFLTAGIRGSVLGEE